MQTHILGFPRIGDGRELKKALESFWKGQLSQADLDAACRGIRQRHWQVQKDAGLGTVTTGDFSLYDQVLDTTAMLGAVPQRFGHAGEAVDLNLYFRMARGDVDANLAAMEMTKWFNTNYHYIVPEIGPGTKPRLACSKIIDETREALDAGFTPKPVLVGPITYLALSKGVDGFDPWQKFDEVLAVYAEVVAELGRVCGWIQLDEPILCADMSEQAREAFAPAYRKLNAAAGKARLLLATYFESLDDNLDLAVNSGCAGLHLDLVRGASSLDTVLAALPDAMTLSAGVVEGRNVWKADCARALKTLDKIKAAVGADRLMVASSCSLLHCPVDLDSETALDAELKSWMAFAVQKCAEVALLGDAAGGGDRSADLEANASAIASRAASSRVNNPAVAARVGTVDASMISRNSPYAERTTAQTWLNLPKYPTTTIGSYPQTREIRAKRLAFKKGECTQDDYKAFMRAEIKRVVDFQEDCGLDVLVHGEPERNDMVEYFGQQMDGFCFTQNGWVQSYGSRCVKPPVIFGDVSRPNPMTVDWITYAQSLTEKPMKGMLTGPVTILCWSFVRDDMDRADVCRQIGLAIRDEVQDLEQAGIRIIQIDEAAFSEGMPIKARDKAGYLRWAVDCFRLSTSGVEDSTQIHTHMCYSEFNEIIRSIAEMDADVISIESSRSRMELLDAFTEFEYPNEIGPGVYDIHSPRVPTSEEMVDLLNKALVHIKPERLWVNPDCGLKTRDWPEVTESLRNMVAAAQAIRKQ